MRITEVRLHRVSLPLVRPFRTAHGIETRRDALLIEMSGPDTVGWGECVAESAPTYTSEYVDGAQDVIRRYLLPRLDARSVNPIDLHERFSPVQGHFMAKAAIEAAALDAHCRILGQSFASRLGATSTRVPSGVAVGLHDSASQLLDTIEEYLDQGYQRIKLKIEPGNDIQQVEAVRQRFPEIALQVDANCSYSLADADHLRTLDDFALLLIEQPLREDDLLSHATLATLLNTPICLDETITSIRVAAVALALGACQIINIKPGRVGGYLEAVKIHDLCLANGVPVWCGGMLETGIGRAGNVALAALPGFTLPGDLSASDRYFHRDVTEAFHLVDGHLEVPNGPGIGVDPLAERLAAFTTSVESIRLE